MYGTPAEGLAKSPRQQHETHVVAVSTLFFCFSLRNLRKLDALQGAISGLPNFRLHASGVRTQKTLFEFELRFRLASIESYSSVPSPETPLDTHSGSRRLLRPDPVPPPLPVWLSPRAPLRRRSRCRDRDRGRLCRVLPRRSDRPVSQRNGT